MSRRVPTPLQLCFLSHRIYFALRRYLAEEKLGDLDAFERAQSYFDDALLGERGVKEFKRRRTFTINAYPRQLEASKAYNRIIDVLEVMYPEKKKEEEELALFITEFADTTKVLLNPGEPAGKEKVETMSRFFKTLMDTLMANELALPVKQAKVV